MGRCDAGLYSIVGGGNKKGNPGMQRAVSFGVLKGEVQMRSS